jgi:macrolide transport system ATP-binding/permease protein
MLRIFGQHYVRSVTVAVRDLSQIDSVQDRVTSVLSARHNNNQDFFVRNMAEILETATTAQNTLTILLASVAAISLLVGGIGVMNIMLVSVTERTREIGIRMATGARTRDILQQFLTEATAVSALGGVIGVLAGLGCAALIGAFGTPVAYTLAPVAIAFTCAVATGLVFGFAPAMKAARLDPVVALASE